MKITVNNAEFIKKNTLIPVNNVSFKNLRDREEQNISLLFIN